MPCTAGRQLVVIHTDSWTGLQALQQPASQGQREAHHHHPRQPTEPCRAGRRVRLTTDPQPRRGPRYEAADAAAKRAANGPSVTMHDASRLQPQGQAERPLATALTRHTESWKPEEAGGLVRCSHRLPPTGRHPATTQGRWRTTAACASGLLHQRGATGGLRGASVRPLRDVHPSPTGALPPVLPRHRPPEARPGSRHPACRWGAAEWA
ncbi:hypothetical protein GWK47_035185 [Chionoecetes opilio]|uniref:Uncharacterized protein n=1 Tax=Chionoecetes opilio TaxID=41210 RepID=A0A8J4YIC6_CHIOP|nr:hypothetical protein GWK47_035185 [Chionoecetes opilio]